MKKILAFIGFASLVGMARLFIAAVIGGYFLLSSPTPPDKPRPAAPKIIHVNADQPDCESFITGVGFEEASGVKIYKPHNEAERQAILLHQSCLEAR